MAASFLALSAEEAEERMRELGVPAFHARSIRRELFQRKSFDYEVMTSLPRDLRTRLSEELPLLAGRESARSQSADGTTKLLIEFDSGARVETVHMPSHKRDRGATLCVSTQVGCAVGCPFCASGALGLERNLAAHEILEQFLRGRAIGPLSRAVIMGIGEPLLNYAALERALRVVNAELGLGARKITVSTVGFPKRLRRIAPLNPRFQLAISLHSPFDEERGRLVPAMKDVPIEDVLEAGDFWFETTGRELTYEYVLLGGTNDSLDHARALGRRLRARRAGVNLIPYNPVQLPSSRRFERPDKAAVQAFQEELQRAGVVATVRWSRGLDRDAACGQLRISAPRSFLSP